MDELNEVCAKLLGVTKADAVDLHETIEAFVEVADGVLESNDLKAIWQLGKKCKGILDTYEDRLTQQECLNINFLWGTALVHLSSKNDDDTLAQAAVEKFQEIQEMEGVDELDASILSQWASALLIIAIAKQDVQVLASCLQKYRDAIEASDEETKFETRFQFAKALKEGIHLLRICVSTARDTNITESTSSGLLVSGIHTKKRKLHLSSESLYEEAITICQDLLLITNGGRDVTGSESESEFENEDVADIYLLQGQLIWNRLQQLKSLKVPWNHSTHDDAWALAHQAFQTCVKVCPQSLVSLEEYNNFLIQSVDIASPKIQEVLLSHLREVEKLIRMALTLVGVESFDIQPKVHAANALEEEEDEEELEEIDPNGPVLADALGRNLLEQLLLEKPNQSEKDKRQELIHCLRFAYHYVAELGCFALARFYARFNNVEKDAIYQECRDYLEACETYEVLHVHDHLHAFLYHSDFNSVRELDWYQAIHQRLKEDGVIDDKS